MNSKRLDGPDDLRVQVAAHDKQLGDLTTQVQSLAADVRSVTNSVGQMAANMTRLEATITQQVDRIATEWRQRSEREKTQLESRPTQILEYIRTTLNILQASAFLIGAVVACIVYVSSNANNAELAVMKYRLEQAEKARDRASPWAPTVEKHVSSLDPPPKR